ncbi:hypothetical protein Tco_0189554 [Tanacetum coccineum]
MLAILSTGREFFDRDMSFLDIVSEKVMTNFNVFSLRVLHQVFAKVNHAFIIAHDWDIFESNVVVDERLFIHRYHNPKCIVPLMYRKIRLTASRWEVLGSFWKRAQRQTLNMILGLLAVRFFFSVTLIASSSSSKSSSTKGDVLEGGGVLSNDMLSDSSIFMCQTSLAFVVFDWDVEMENTFPMACNFKVGSYSKLQDIHEVGFVDQGFFLVEVS